MFDAPFQCNIYIQNNTNHTFTRSKYHPTGFFDRDGHGKYETKPPATVSPGAHVKFVLNKYDAVNEPVGYGPQGSCTYQAGDITFKLTFECPTHDDNSADVSYSGAIKVVVTPNPLPESGHPMYVQFTITDA